MGRQDRALEGGMTFSISTVMGRRDEPLLEVAARQLAEALSLAGCDRCAVTMIEGHIIILRPALTYSDTL